MNHTVHSNSDILLGAKILLVEDNLINQDVAAAMLTQRGMIVEIADNGKQAIEKLLEDEYDCILMDIQMPIMDGNTATRIIRQELKYSHLPILALTAKVLDSDIKEALAAGMNCHIAKPINLELLLDKMAYWISSSKQQQNVEKTDSGQNHLMAECIAKVGGSKSLFIKIISVFVEKHHDDAVQIKQMLKEGNDDGARSVLHSLKGVSLVVGAKDLHGTTTELEKRVVEETAVQIAPLLQQFEKELQGTISHLQRYIARNNKQ